MMIQPTIYISVTDDKQQLVIDGSLALLRHFIASFSHSEQHNKNEDKFKSGDKNSSSQTQIEGVSK